jgi:hypothetical protein
MEINQLYNFLELFFNNFFFSYYASSEFIGVYRIAACSILLTYFTVIFKDIIIFSRVDGIYSYEAFKNQMESQENILNLFLYLKFKCSNYLIIGAFYLFGILALIGLYTNISLILFFILFLSLQSRVTPINTSGGDIVANFILFLLCFMDSGANFSLDSFLSNQSPPDLVAAWPLRLIQISISFGYLWSALIKINSQDWFLGHAVSNAVLFSPWGKRNFKTLFTNRYLGRIFCISIIFYQFFAPILFWVQEFRPFAIVFGVIIHLGMSLTLRIGYFGPIMILGILSFAANYFR